MDQNEFQKLYTLHTSYMDCVLALLQRKDVALEQAIQGANEIISRSPLGKAPSGTPTP